MTAVAQQARFARHLRARHSDRSRLQLLRKRSPCRPRTDGTPAVIASIRDLGLYLTAMQRLVQRHVCRLADRVVVNAQAVKDWLVGEGYDPGKIVVDSNGSI